MFSFIDGVEHSLDSPNNLRYSYIILKYYFVENNSYFCNINIFKEDEKFLSERNLTQLILPLCTTYLLNPDYVKHSQLVEQAIVLFGAICRTLPWTQYEIYIKYYTGLFSKVGRHVEFKRMKHIFNSLSGNFIIFCSLRLLIRGSW